MKRAIGLALRGWGRTSPNPMVGSVVVKNGRIVGEGYHRQAGTPHAEINALRDAGGRAKGADLYVTLEPCCHHGLTPPCTDRIIRAGIRRVVIGTLDPNPIVYRRGVGTLKKAGIAVKTGVLADACHELNRWYETALANDRPFAVLKVAMSLDGKIAAHDGSSQWITGKECRQYVHRLRDNADAIVVGRGTILKDNPRLTVRVKGRRTRAGRVVVLDEKLDLPSVANVFDRPPECVIVATTGAAPAGRVAALGKRGFDVIVCPHNGRGHISLPHLMRSLYRRRIIKVLIEGGGEIYADFVREGLVDHVVACIAPKIIGGEGKDAFPDITINAIDDALRITNATMRCFGHDFVVEGGIEKRRYIARP